ncbi:MAG: aminopeptidase P family N-terminal domain-containing protein, partial [Bacillota bacterium]
MGATSEGRRQEVEVKRQRLNRLMTALELDGILIGRRDNFAWATGGADNHVKLATETGAGMLLVLPDRWTLIATNIETPRLSREELESLPVPLDVEAAPWHLGVESAVERLVRGRRVGSDTGIAGTMNVHPALAGLRLPLT